MKPFTHEDLKRLTHIDLDESHREVFDTASRRSINNTLISIDKQPGYRRTAFWMVKNFDRFFFIAEQEVGGVICFLRSFYLDKKNEWAELPILHMERQELLGKEEKPFFMHMDTLHLFVRDGKKIGIYRLQTEDGNDWTWVQKRNVYQENTSIQTRFGYKLHTYYSQGSLHLVVAGYNNRGIVELQIHRYDSEQWPRIPENIIPRQAQVYF